MANGLVHQIQEWRERGGESRIGAEFTWKVRELEQLWNQRAGDPSTADFVVIRLVTVIEVFCRVTLATLVDTSPEFVDRAEPLFKNVKLDFSITKSLHGRRITLGELMAHSLSLSSVGAILAAYEALLPGFRKGLDTITERWVEDQHKSLLPILPDAAKAIGTVDRLLQARHILAHELPREPPYEVADVPHFVAATHGLLDAIDWQVVARTKGYVPRTQLNMNAEAGDEAARQTTALDEAVSLLVKRGDMNPEKVSASHAAWQAFADADSAMYASYAEGGSMESMLYSGHLAELTRKRLEMMREWLSREEGTF